MTEEYGISYPDWNRPSGAYPFPTNIDLTELAARLGGLSTRMRGGKVLFQCPFEDAELEGWAAASAGKVFSAGHGAFGRGSCAEVRLAPGQIDSWYFQLPLIKDDLTGFEISFYPWESLGKAYWTQRYVQNGPVHSWGIEVQAISGHIMINTAPGYTLTTHYVQNVWNTLKIVVDYSTNRFVRFYLNEDVEEVDHPLWDWGASGTTCLDLTQLFVTGALADPLSTWRLQNFIITTDEIPA